MTKQKEINLPTLWSRLFTPGVTKEEYEQLEDSNSPPPELGIGFSNCKWIIAAGLIVIALFFGVGGLFISCTRIDGAVIAPGIVKAEAERQTVQHLEGGIVKEILVKEGDPVEKGQPLMTLTSTSIFATVDQLRGQLHAKQITAARLQAEKSLLPEITWPPELLTESGVPLNTDLQTMMRAEQKIFSSRQQGMQDQIAILNKQIEQLTGEIASLHAQSSSAEEIIESLNGELQVKQALSDERFLDKSVVLDLRRRLAEARSRRAALRGSVAENREKISELKIYINGLHNSFTEQAIAELGPINMELLDLRERLRPLVDAQARLTITAPITGEIASLKVHSPGGVIPPGGKILDILPKDSALVVECLIQVQDITKLKPGQQVKVRLSAFNIRTLDKVDGHITYISADRHERQSAYGMQPFYLVHISLDQDDLRRRNMYISAGMPAMAFFILQPRTILNYIMEPLSQSFDEDETSY